MTQASQLAGGSSSESPAPAPAGEAPSLRRRTRRVALASAQAAAAARYALGALARLGGGTLAIGVGINRQVSAVAAIVRWSAHPGTWRRPTRQALIRQLYFTAVQATPFVLLLALVFGFGFVFQVLYWLEFAGQRGAAGTIIAMLLVREIAPVLIGVILLGRSGLATVSELGGMQVRGQTHALEAQGVDPFLFLVIPRGVALALGAAMLMLLFLLVSLLTGIVASNAVGATSLTTSEFFELIVGALAPTDHLALALKPLLIGLFIGAHCSLAGLSVQGSYTQIPGVLPRAFGRGLLGTFLISGLITLLL